MEKSNFSNGEQVNALKWSAIAEISAKLMSPVLSMILARVISPESYGIIASITIVTSFVEILTDTGFKLYINQKNFNNKFERDQFCNVAFWTNLVLSSVFWILVILFREQITNKLGCPGCATELVIASMCMPITSFSSIQFALYRKDLRFDDLFKIRCVTIIIPLVIVLPIALILRNHWALIIGNVSIAFVTAILMTFHSDWKPTLFYSTTLLREMLSFSIWTILESICVWLNLWLDTIIISNNYGQYYLGLYKNSTNIISGLSTVVTAAIIPVMFSVLSKCKKQESLFQDNFLFYQKLVSYIVFPLGAGILLYSDVATCILLGSKWAEAESIIGVVGFALFINIAFTNVIGQTLVAYEKPKMSFLLQIIHLCFLIPVCLISMHYGFWTVIYARTIIRLQAAISYVLVLAIVCKISVKRMMNNVAKPILCTILMVIVAIFMRSIIDTILMVYLSIIICIFIYFTILCFVDKPFIHKIKIVFQLKKNN